MAESLSSEHAMSDIWYSGRKPPLWLRALSCLFAAVGAGRRWMYRAGWLRRVRLPVPVIVVGNITVGGTGKTPLTIALVEALRERGFRPGVISRGYGGSAAVATRIDAHSDPAVVGDEARLIFDAAGVPVAVARKRAQAGRLLLESGAIDVLVADDGLQHYALRRDIEICVIDGARRFGNGRLLPAGPLREPVARLDSVDFRVCNGGVAQANEVPMTLAGDIAISIAEDQEKSLADFAGQRAHAVAGIGNPSRFFERLREMHIDIDVHAFADHHAFVASDLAFGNDLPVLMTSKDAVKCAAFARNHWWHVPVRAQLPSSFFDAVADRLRRLKSHN
jgi:tetraacyldisaccharide 4'-kinase